MLKALLNGPKVEAASRLGTGLGALFAAEMWFKWHSFTLECLGFLGTWVLLDAAVSSILRSRTAARQTQPVSE